MGNSPAGTKETLRGAVYVQVKHHGYGYLPTSSAFVENGGEGGTFLISGAG